MTKYLIHVDDFGRSKKISEKILKYVIKKKISSVSVMIGFIKSNLHKSLKFSCRYKSKRINKNLNVKIKDIFRNDSEIWLTYYL